MVADVPPDAAYLRDPASFRDPSGFVYRRDGTLLRQVDRSFGARWDDVVKSGLFDRLHAAGRLIPHETADPTLAADDRAHAVIRPEELPLMSYPYEWSFGMLRDAALLTLEVQAEIAADGFTLAHADADSFAGALLVDVPPPPADQTAIVAANRAGRIAVQA